ncbi:hypothetical protein IWX65_002607 [Arthrobacter sp. CAN_A214]|uniref:acyl-CoA carboxylase subunit epsilon n=1 Tax=Arthrobacter sp. CAN_A214 TaxID=2787720 RepID=UPI001A2D541B
MSGIEPGRGTDPTPAGTSETANEPVLSVVSGNPTDEELAALTAVVVALQGETGGPAEGSSRSWLRRTMLRLKPLPGPGSWKRSAR